MRRPYRILCAYRDSCRKELMITKRLAFAVLGIFLILSGLIHLIPGVGDVGIVISVFALVAGVLVLITRMEVSNMLGWFFSSVYLIITGLHGVFGFSFTGMQTVLAIFILGGGVMLLIGWPGLKHHIGFILFCFWAILTGLTNWVTFGYDTLIIATLAILSGLLLILQK